MGIVGRFFMRVVQDPAWHHLFIGGLGLSIDSYGWIPKILHDPKYLIPRELWDHSIL